MNCFPQNYKTERENNDKSVRKVLSRRAAGRHFTSGKPVSDTQFWAMITADLENYYTNMPCIRRKWALDNPLSTFGRTIGPLRLGLPGARSDTLPNIDEPECEVVRLHALGSRALLA
jgi:hypothetical protein